ncbi:hypothetical protein P3T20_002205 [Paraburkholderia sp. GAS206C]
MLAWIKQTDMKNKPLLALSLVASLVLTACGGGGGSGSSTTPAATSASSPSAASAPVASAPVAASTPTVNGETLPSLTSPQAGSTVATGNGLQGIWTANASGDKTTAFIDAQNNISYLSTVLTLPVSQFFGVISPTSTTWTLTSGVQFLQPFFYATTSGSGTFTANQAFSGSFVANSSTVNLSWTYDPANALAVTQASVVGTWAETNSSITVDSSGAVTGTLSSCPVTGTLLLTSAGSSQNLYSLSLTTGTAAACATPGKTLSGNAAIVFLPISGSTLYARSILYVIHSSDNSAVAYGQVSPQ